ncbi:O-acetylhomoserine aminocarboxypropyltransferase/cysteine synthase family protein [Sulfobacillus harzensis]|nr:O-acetylhomoserine aminocarboxypropyltransferase/cysteine synthase family protein [Sulfobacillus harzensis]
MSETKHWRPDTLAVHGGYGGDPASHAISVPIYQTVGYRFDDTGHAARLFNLEEPGNIYTRIMNPTTDVLEQRLALLEGGVGAVAFSSGMAAITGAILNLARAGDEIVASTSLYGGTWTLFTSTLQDYGISVRFVADDQLAEGDSAFTDRTRAVFIESIGNPRLNVADIRAWADLAHRHGVPLIVDNTFATPYLERPIEHGADIVIHSLTKWIGGHGNAMGGIVVDAGRFDYNSARFPYYQNPDGSYHGLVFASLGEAAYITRLRVKVLRDTGAAISPTNAYYILQGVETLPVRIRRQCDNARTLAERLSQHPEVAWVNYPGLPDDPAYDVAQKYLSDGLYGAMLNFGVKGGHAQALEVMNRLSLWLIVANVGDARSMAIHPASTTHQQLSDEEKVLAGAAGDLIRLSVGLEHPDDLWEDLEQALERR